MQTNHRRLLVAALFSSTAIVTAGSADAAIRFHSGPSVDVNGLQVCTSANVSGVGNENIDVLFDVRYTATTTCRNKGGNVAPGQPLVSGTFRTTSAPIEPKNGRAQIDKCSNAISPSDFVLPPASQVCPNGNWSVDPIQAGNISIFSYSVTVLQGSTTLYTCNSNTQSCST